MDGFETGNTATPEGDFFANGTVSDDMPLDDYVEPDVIRDKAPHELTVAQVTIKVVESKGTQKEIVDFLMRPEDTGLMNVKLVKYSLWLPHSADTPEQRNVAKGRMIKVQKALNMSPAKTLSEFKDRIVGEATGAKIKAVLKVRHSDEYGDSNEVERLLV